MSIVKMKKIQVIGMDRDRDRLIRDLMNLGAVEISSKKPEENEGAANLLTDSDMEQIQKLDQEISDTELALETLDKYSPEKRPLFFTRSEMGRQSFEAVLTESDTIRRQRGEILELHEKLHQMNEERNRASSEIMSLEPWEAYGAPLEQKETESCMISLGILPQNPQDDLRAKLEEAGDTWMLETVRQDKNYLYLLFVCMKQDADVYQNLLKQAGWTEAPFRDLKGTVAECEADARERIADIEEKIRGVEADITGRFNQKKTIECYHDGLLIERDRIAVKGNLLHTERTFLFEGWVPVPAVKKVEKCLDASGCYYQLSDPSEEDTVPVLTKAGKFVYPFEAITSMYSLPDYHGIDPTSFFAIFYALFFGMMLSDAGYGVIITVATALILKKYKLEGTTYQMIKMFFYCGIATIFWGALFGSWFGNFVQVFSGTFLGKEVSIRPIWFDPIQDPTRLLVFSLCFGVVHLFVAMGLEAYLLIRDGHWFDAVCDVFSWYLVVGGAGIYLVFDPIKKAGGVMFIIGILMLLIFGGRKKKGFGKVIGGLGAVYNITEWISNILSYARLLALGLATGVIAQVVNTIGTLAGGGVKGAIVMIVVFLIGHVMNLVINALGAFVHSSRLQYIEFFGKFYIDGGDPFDPFRAKTKYVRLMDDSNNGGNSL